MTDCMLLFLQDLLRFCLFALGIQLVLLAISIAPWLSKGHVSTSEIVVQVISTIVAAMPVAIPTVIVCSNGVCASKLRARGIRVLSIDRLKSAADVSIVCFDKTGTLTASLVRCSAAPTVDKH